MGKSLLRSRRSNFPSIKKSQVPPGSLFLISLNTSDFQALEAALAIPSPVPACGKSSAIRRAVLLGRPASSNRGTHWGLVPLSLANLTSRTEAGRLGSPALESGRPDQ